MKTIQNRYYFTVEDMLNGTINGQEFNVYIQGAAGLFNEDAVESRMFNLFKFKFNDSVEAPEAYKFYHSFLASKMHEYCFASWNGELATEDKLSEDARLFYGRFLEWWNESSARFIPLIKLYKSQEDNLMDGAKGSQTATISEAGKVAESQYPTSATFQSYPATDELASASQTQNSSTSTSQSDVMSEDVIDHLDKVRTKLLNIYDEWLRSFAKRFIIYVR